jgi:nucleoredoxin
MKNTALWLLVLMVIGSLGRAATLQEVVADPKLWPAEVIVPATAKATVIKNGQPGGMMLVGAGRKITVTGVAADGVTGKMGGATIKVAVEKTDLMQRLDPSYVPAVAAAEETGDGRPEAGSSDSAAVEPPSVMQRRLSGKVVRLAGNMVQPVGDKPLAGVKYYGLYYSASWCGPCRAFTPGFITTYRQIKQKHPEFEVVFMSADRSAEDMREYMKADGMPWLALKYELRGQNPELMRYAGDGIPCLVLVDASGRVLSDSYQGGNYVGPAHVLRETIRILEGGR